MSADSDDFALTDKQSKAADLLMGDATTFLLYGGARSAKTFLCIRYIINRAVGVPGSRHAVFRKTFNDVKRTVVNDTLPKVMALCFPGFKEGVHYTLNKQDSFVTFANGSEVWFGGLDDKERTDKILGAEYATIFLNECSQISYATYITVCSRLAQQCFWDKEGVKTELRLRLLCDENPPMRGHWTYKLFIQKKDPETGRDLQYPEDYVSLLMNPRDNLDNLPSSFLKRLEQMPKRQRDRFLLGLFGSEGENALWTIEIIEKSKINKESPDVPEMVRVVVAVDPSGASDDPDTTNDAIGIIVVGLGTDHIAYVLADSTLTAGPAAWGREVARVYEEYAADRVIGEVNYGGAMVEYVIKSANQNIAYKPVRASRGKMIRAEPVSALHETGKVRLVGDYPELEDELLNSTTMGYTGARSPNRLDAYVFAVTELFPSVTSPTKKKKWRTAPRAR